MVLTGLSINGSILSINAEELSTETYIFDDGPSIRVGEEMHTVIIPGEEPEQYCFVPEQSGIYHFYSIGAEDTYGYLYDEEMNLLAEDNDSGTDLNFLIVAELQEGMTYYLCSDLFMEGETEITSVIEMENVEVSYDLPEDTSAILEDDTDTGDVEEVAEQEIENNGATASGKLTDTMSWKLLNGVLTISTTAKEEEMPGLWGNANPWYSMKTQIKRVVINKGVISIGNYGFDGCTALTQVTLPDGLRFIEGGSFRECTSLKQLQLPDSLQSVYSSAFENSAIERFTIRAGSKRYTVKDGILYNKAMTVIELIPPKKTGEYRIPSTVTTIRSYTFRETSLSKIIIPDSVVKIWNGAFYGCESLETVSIGKGVSEIPESAFANCKCLKTVVLPNREIKIQVWAFAGCVSLDTIQGGEHITEIGASAFADCPIANIPAGLKIAQISSGGYMNNSKIKRLTVPRSVVSIQYYAFKNCSDLTTVTMSNHVTDIQYGAFKDCTKLVNIQFSNSIQVLGARAFDNTEWYKKQPKGLVYAGSMVYSYKGGMASNAKLTLKKGVTGIAVGAFEDQKNLRAVSIPSGVKNINTGAFLNCNSLKQIELPSSVESIGYAAIGFNRVDYGEGIDYADYYYNTEYAYRNLQERRGIDYETGINNLSLYYIRRIPGVVIIADKGSVGERYAKAYGITYRERTTYTIQYVLNGGRNASDNPINYKKNGATVTLKTPTRNGYTFAGWYTDAGCTKRITRISKGHIGDITLYAKWKTTSKLSNTEAYVARIYTKALGRTADPAGLKYWAEQIKTKKKTPVAVAEAFFFTPEFENKRLSNTEYVKVLYRTFMGREYDQAGLNYWVNRLKQGESRKSVLKAFAGCPEFQRIVKGFGL